MFCRRTVWRSETNAPHKPHPAAHDSEQNERQEGVHIQRVICKGGHKDCMRFGERSASSGCHVLHPPDGGFLDGVLAVPIGELYSTSVFLCYRIQGKLECLSHRLFRDVFVMDYFAHSTGGQCSGVQKLIDLELKMCFN